MRAFEVEPDDLFPHNYYIDATHKWTIPGVHCPRCGFKGSVVGGAYPSITLPPGVAEKPYLEAWPVSPDRIRELGVSIRALVPDGLPFGSGTEFGPLCGKASGRFGDLTWLNPSTPLISPEALAKLASLGITGLETAAPQMVLRSKRKVFGHLELCLYPLVHTYDPNPARKCPECGAIIDPQPEMIEPWRPIILKDSWPKGVHLTRVFEAPGFVIASEQFVNAAMELALTDIKFEELEVR